MGTLRDEAYEKLDYLSQLTEIVVSPQNEILGRLPDKLELSFDLIKQVKTQSWNRAIGYELSLQSVLTHLLHSDEYRYINDILPHFEFQVSEDLVLDFSENTMVGTLEVIKLTTLIEEKKLLEIAVRRAHDQLSSYSLTSKHLRERFITVINILEPGRGTTWAQNATGKVNYIGIAEIKRILSDLILENKWRIRDVNIIEKVGQWINSYLANGNELGLMNLLKLKIMVDKDLPIYSVDEVKNVNPI